MLSVTARAHLTPGKDPVPIVQEAGWASGPVWTGAEKLAPTGILSPDRPARRQSLYRLRYPDGQEVWATNILCSEIEGFIYRVVHKSVKHFKNSQQIDYATDHGNSYVDRERNCLSFFFKGKSRAHCCPDLPLGDSSSKYGVQYRTHRTRR